MRKQAGIALITTLLLLLLMAAMVVGFMLLVQEGQRLSGMDSDQLRAFYGAESGMEKLTADLGSLFGKTYSPSIAQVNALTTGSNVPSLPASTGVAFVDAQGNSTYTIVPSAFDTNGNPRATYAQITSGSSAFQGMSALETTYTLTVGALTNTGAQVKLQRTTQTVGIPLFQFGIFSETDLSFFPGPNFDFGGRVHTNGNLFLNSGGPSNATPTQTTVNQLWMRSPVTASGDILRDCLANGNPESTVGIHPGSVEITKGGSTLQALGFGQGSYKGCLGTGSANTGWPAISASFNGNLRSGVKPLNLTIVLLGNGSTKPIDMIRRPVAGEDSSNPGVLNERYFAQASLRILLSDNASDITSLPCVSPGAPLNLAHLAQPVIGWTSYTDSTALQTAMTLASTPALPLAASGAATGAYVPGYLSQLSVTSGTPGGDGYWQTNATPIITGYIKIEAINAPFATNCSSASYKDVTTEILSLGYAGKNINPVPQSFDGNNLNQMWGTAASSAYTLKMELGAAPALPAAPTSQMAGQNGPPLAAGVLTAPNLLGSTTGTCLDPHPNAVIRLERIRDNPTSVAVQLGAFNPGGSPRNVPKQSTVAQACGVDPATGNLLAGWTPAPYDFWPNALYDTREGHNRETAPTGAFINRVTLGGIMNYIELDVSNLAKWFNGTIGTSGKSTQDNSAASNNFVVYISDRRSNYAPAGTIVGGWPPASPSGNETGEYGYNDNVNSADLKGCPDNLLDPVNYLGVSPEDPDGNSTLYTYGEFTFPNGLVDSSGVVTNTEIFTNTLPPSPSPAVLADPNGCHKGSGGIFPWPGAFLSNSNEGRENPVSLFRRSVKIVNGNLISMPTCSGSGVTAIPCGLAITTENPAYIQGDFNANSNGNQFNDPSVAASVVGDAVTILSNNWNDVNSFAFPFNNPSNRTGTTTYVRSGIVGGKQITFAIPGWDTNAIDGSQDFGTDGGVHNFLRFLEHWNGTLFYQGSIISMFYSRQANGLFNSGGNNYSPPTRGYSFDVNFLNPTLLPPRTPMFRDINTTGFTQLMLPNQ